MARKRRNQNEQNGKAKAGNATEDLGSRFVWPSQKKSTPNGSQSQNSYPKKKAKKNAVASQSPNGKKNKPIEATKAFATDEDFISLDSPSSDNGYWPKDEEGEEDEEEDFLGDVLELEDESEQTKAGGKPPHKNVIDSFKQFEKDMQEKEDGDSGNSRKRRRSSATSDEGSDDDALPHKRQDHNREFPWIRKGHDHSNEKDISRWLTKEIRDFVAYMSPHEAEIRARNDAVSRIRQAVKDLWKDAEAYVFGSFATDMYLPGSDIDIVVLSKQGNLTNPSCMHLLAHKLRTMSMATNMQVLTKTRVPIIKFVEIRSKINIDISFERTNGVQAVALIRKWQQSYPALRHLAIVIKHFLARRGMNEVHTGGLGGLSVICLVVSFLANHPRISSGTIDAADNLGPLLIEFFELYGSSFNYEQLGLSMTGSMPYLRKDDYIALQNRNQFALSILDPLDSTNNLSRGSFNLSGIRQAFRGAFTMLCTRCYEANSLRPKWRRGMSLLGNIIQFKGPERDFSDYTDAVRNESQDISMTTLHSSIRRQEADADPFYYDSTDDEVVKTTISQTVEQQKITKVKSKQKPRSNPLDLDNDEEDDSNIIVISDDEGSNEEAISRTRMH